MHVHDMSYGQWQKRNSNAFSKLTKKQQQESRQRGYYNVRWERVQRSWEILKQMVASCSMFATKLRKGDVAGAVNQSILEAELAQKVAKQALADLSRKRKGVEKLAITTLNKYQLL